MNTIRIQQPNHQNSSAGKWKSSRIGQKLEVNTLQGDVIVLEVLVETTLGELEAMLLEKRPAFSEDPMERKLLTVELLRDSTIVEMDDAQTVGAAGLLEAEAITTAIYKRNEVEAVTRKDIHTRKLFHLNIPSYCANIPFMAFHDCSNLVSLAITESVTHIQHGAFFGCTSLASITLGESVSHIGREAFQDCISLTSITLGRSVTHLGQSAFRNCTSLASITLGESVTHVGDIVPLMIAPLWRASLWVSL